MKHILPATVIEKARVVCELFTGRENGLAKRERERAPGSAAKPETNDFQKVYSYS